MAKLILHRIERGFTQSSHLLGTIAETHQQIMMHEDLLGVPETNRMLALCRLSSIHLSTTQAQRLMFCSRDGPSASPAEPSELLVAAAFLGEVKLLKALLRAGVDVNRDSDTFGTPLKAAAIQGNLDTAKLLIEHGANANHASGYDADYNKYKGTALQACAKRNHIAVV